MIQWQSMRTLVMALVLSIYSVRALMEGLYCHTHIDEEGNAIFNEDWTEVVDWAFALCGGLKKVHIPNHITRVGNFAFYGNSNLEEVYISDSVLTLGESVFRDSSNLKTVRLSNSLTSVGTSLFRKCTSLENLVIPPTLPVLETAFCKNCEALKVVTLPEGITRIRGEAFYQANFTSVLFPETLESIESGAFTSAIHQQEKLTIPESVRHLGNSVFDRDLEITEVYILSDFLYIAGNIFGGISKLTTENVFFARKLVGTGVSFGVDSDEKGKPFEFAGSKINLDCPLSNGSTYGACGCKRGWGTALPPSPNGEYDGLFNCVPCEKGFMSSPGLLKHDPCIPCEPGRYATSEESITCQSCGAGRYGTLSGASLESQACKPCEKGTWSRGLGSTSCHLCPAGAFCEHEGMRMYDVCPAGFISTSGSEMCTPCPAGRFQKDEGAATCDPCPAGSYGDRLNSTSKSECIPCVAGKYADQEGLHSCKVCSDGYFQPNGNASRCERCEKRMISSPSFRSCEVDPLYSGSLLEVMFYDGVALAITFTTAAIFVVLAVSMYLKRKSDDYSLELAQTVHYDAFLKSFIPGFSMGSDLSFVIGTMNNAPGFASTIISFRCLHLGAGLLCGVCLFSSDKASQPLGALIKWPAHARANLDKKFSGENIPLVCLTLVLSACDITMLQFLPWKKTPFFDASKGFDSMDMMKFCLGIKCLQTFMSAIMQVAFLADEERLNEATSPQAQALFGLNIIMSLAGAIGGLMLLWLKRELLDSVSKTQSSSAEAKRGSAVLELKDVYSASPHTATLDGNVEGSNPMHASERKEIIEVMRQEIQEKDQRIVDLEKRVASLERPLSRPQFATRQPAQKENNDSSDSSEQESSFFAFGE